MYLFGEEIALVDSNANDVQDGLSKLEFFVAQDIFFSKTCQYRRRDLSGQPQPREGRHLHQHGAARPAALPGSRAARRKPARLAHHPGRGRITSARTGITGTRPRSTARSPSLTPLLAGVTYERLEGYKSLQWPVAADCTDQPLLYTEKFAFPDGKGEALPRRHVDAHRPGQRGVRPASQQRPHARNISTKATSPTAVTASAKRCRTPSSRSRPNSPRIAASRAAPGCSSSRATARSASAGSSPTASPASSSTCR